MFMLIFRGRWQYLQSDSPHNQDNLQPRHLKRIIMTTYMQEELEMEEKPINTDVRVCYDRWRCLYKQL